MLYDGYVPINGITHRRRLYYADQGNDLRGEHADSHHGLTKPHAVAVCFHLHPKVNVSLVTKEEAILALPGGTGWAFTASGAQLHIEDSIYLGDGIRPQDETACDSAAMDADTLRSMGAAAGAAVVEGLYKPMELDVIVMSIQMI